jgi:hypothetical protein
MNVLFAIKSCVRDIPQHDAIRETWGKTVPVRFFVGGSHHGWSDEVSVDAPDTYEGLPFKVREMAKWVVEGNYDYAYFCDNDTFIRPERILPLADGVHDYIGRFYWDAKDPTAAKGKYRFAFGGLGYMISRTAAKIIASAPNPTITEEDQWVGSVLDAYFLRKLEMNIGRFAYDAAWHYPKGVYEGFPTYIPEWQRAMYQHHTLGIRANWPLFGTFWPDVNNFPKNPVDCRTHTAEDVIQKHIDGLISRRPSKANSDLIISFAALTEIEAKDLNAVTLVDWGAVAMCYRELRNRLQLGCALNAYEHDYTPKGRLALSQAYYTDGDYKMAYEILRNVDGQFGIKARLAALMYVKGRQ